ncbi:lamin tail domain-containing protein, partial [bacterium]|nr:lamin tail domain-containing protein [bacterium]
MGPVPGCPGRAETRLLTRLLLPFVVGVLTASASPRATARDFVLNEVLPDPSGADDGREFVELLNPGPDPLALDGVRLEFANGADGPVWLVRWTAPDGLVVPAGGRFLLGDRPWAGSEPVDAEVDLGLQNGPDAVRLVRGDLTLDLLGYGPLDDPALFEGHPAGTGAGLALARRPDGRDTDDNAADLVLAVPTPGRPNFHPFTLTLTAAEHEPPVLARPGDVLRVAVRVVHGGTEMWPAGPCVLAWPEGRATAWWDGARPGDERQLAFVLRPRLRGALPLVLAVPAAGGDTVRVDVGTVQVGAAALRLNEVLPAPGAGQGEWVEVLWDGPDPLDLAGYVLADADGGRAELPPRPLAPGGLAVLAADSTGLRRWWRENAASGAAGCAAGAPAAVVVAVSGWPSLNNTPPAGRPYADRLLLCDPRGVVLDAVTWGGGGFPETETGRSLERTSPEPVNPGAEAWAPCTAAAGATPGCPNSGAAAGRPDAGGLAVEPPLLDRA